MKAFCYFVAALLASNVCLAAAGQGVERTAHGVRLDVQGGNFRCEVMFYSPSIVRVVKAPQAAEPEEKSLAVVMTPEKTKFKVTETAGAVTLKSGTVSVTLGKDDGTVSFADAAGNNLLKEQGAPVFTPVTDGANKGYYGVSQSFTLDKDEPVYGIGQLQGGRLNLRGLDKYLVQTNIEDGSPFIQSAKGYGLYFDNYSPMTFKDDAAGMRFGFEVGACVDYYFMYGGNADGVVARVRQLTGQAPMFPLWTYGYWQSRERYKGQDELVGVVRKYRELGVPLDGIIQATITTGMLPSFLPRRSTTRRRCSTKYTHWTHMRPSPCGRRSARKPSLMPTLRRRSCFMTSRLSLFLRMATLKCRRA